jgi:fibronectin type 3 domain-containing protein
MKTLVVTLFLLTRCLSASAPPDPVAVSPTGLSGQLTLSWADVSPAGSVTGYQVYEASYADFSAVTFSTYVIGTSVTLSTETDGQLEYFVVMTDPTTTAQSSEVSGSSYAAAPGSLSVVPTGISGQLSCSWAALTLPAGVTGYQVYRALDAAFSSAVSITDVPATTGTVQVLFTDSTDNVSTFFKVLPDTAGTAFSATTSASSFAAAPGPLSVTATGISGQLSCSWAALTQPAGVTGYQVYRALDAAFSSAVSITDVPATTGTVQVLFTDSTDNVSTFFKVLPDTAGTAFSATTSASSFAAAPGSLTVTATGIGRQLSCSWAALTQPAGVTGYEVYRALDAAFSSAVSITDVPATTGTVQVLFTDSTDYVSTWFKVLPDTAGTAFSLTASAVSFQVAPAPLTVNAAATGKSGQIQVSWSPVTVPAGVSEYQLFSSANQSLSPSASYLVASTSTVLAGFPDAVPQWFAVEASVPLGAVLSAAVSASSSAAAPAPVAVALSSTGVSGQLRFSWSAVTAPAGVTGYQVFRASYPDLSLVSPEAYVTRTSLVDNGLTDGSFYWYAVAADHGGAQSLTLSAASSQALGAPAVTVTALSFGGGISVQWSPPALHGFAVGAYGVLQLKGASVSLLSQVGGDASGVTLDLPCGTAATIAVQAVDLLGVSGAASVTQTASYPCGPVISPLGLSNSAMTLGWSALPSAPDPISSFQVFYATVPGLPDPLPYLDVSAAGNALSAVASAAPQQQTRYYRVYSVDAAGVTSTGSNELGLMAPPVIVGASGRHSSLWLDWTRPAVSTDFKLKDYQVYYATYAPPLPSAAGTTVLSVPDPGSGSLVAATVSAGLNDGVPEFLAVSARGGDGVEQEGVLGLTVSATPGLPTPLITSFSQVQGGPVTLAWSPVDASPNTPAVYAVYASDDQSFNGRVLQASLTSTAAYLTPVASTSQYWFVVISDTAGNSSALSPAAGALFFAPLLTAPVVSMAVTSNSRVLLSWPAVPQALEYQVYRATPGISPSASVFATSDQMIVEGSAYLDVAPVNSEPNVYEVLARRTLTAPASQVESAFSAFVTATPSILPGVPGAYYSPSGSPPGLLQGTYLTATARPSLNAVDLSWAPSALGTHLLSSYQVYQGYGYVNMTPAATVAAPLTSCSLTVADPLGLSYMVVAVDSAGSVSLPLTGTALPYAPWPAPQTPTAFVLGSAVHLAWSPPLGAGNEPFSAYEVFRTDVPGASPHALSVVTQTAYVDLGARAVGSTQLTYGIAAIDALALPGSLTQVGASFSAPAFVTVTPSAPQGVVAKAVTGSALAEIQWQPNPETDHVSSYVVYQDGAFLLATTLTSAVDSSAVLNSSHSYSVQAVNATAPGLSATASPSPLSVDPPQPSGLVTSYLPDASGNTTPAQRLQWADLGVPGGVSSYVVYRSTAPGALVELAELTVTSYADTSIGAVAAAAVSYTVVGKVGVYQSASPVAQLLVSVAAPLAAPALSASQTGSGVSLSWPAQPQAQQFLIFRSSSALGAYPPLSQRVGVTSNLNFIDATDLGAVQNYAVEADNYLSQGPAGFLSVTPLPGAATNLTLSAGYNGAPEILLSWSAPLAPSMATGYEVSRATAGATGAVIAFVSTTAYVDSGMSTNTAYTYQVRSADLGYGPGILAGPVLAHALPPAPSGLQARGGPGRLDLSWSGPNAADGVTGYALSLLPWSPPLGPLSFALPVQPSAFSLSGLAEAQGVTFTLTAFNSAWASAPSMAGAQANAVGPVALPLSFSAKVGFYDAVSVGVRVQLNWAPLDPSQKAILYRSTGALPLTLAAGGGDSPFYLTGMAGIVGTYDDFAVSSAGEAYSYALTAVGPAGLPGAESLPVSAGPVSPFSYPSALSFSATAGMGRVDLQWNPPSYTGSAGLAAVPYRLYRFQTTATVSQVGVLQPDAGFPLALSSTVYTDTQVTNGLPYLYVVSVVDALGREQNQLEAANVTPEGPLPAPQSVLAIPGDATVTLRWVANLTDTQNGLKYNVYRRDASLLQDYGPPVPTLLESGPSSIQEFPTGITLTVVTLLDVGSPTSLSNTSTYCYTIDQVNLFGEGGKSPEVCVTPYKPLRPGNPTVTLTVVNKSDVLLTWSSAGIAGSGSYNLNGFRVYRSPDGGNTYVALTTTAPTLTSFVDAKTQFGSAYIYRVLPVDDHGNEGLTYNLVTVSIPAAVNAILVFRNSFNPSSSDSSQNSVAVQCSLLQPGHFSVKIYTLEGEYVATIPFVDNTAPPSTSVETPFLSDKQSWKGKNEAGNTVASGVYLLHLEAPGYRADARVAVIK